MNIEISHASKLSDLTVRSARVEDATGILALMERLERIFPLLYAPGERSGVDAVRGHIEALTNQPNSTFLIATVEQNVVGYLFAEGGKLQRTRHSAYVVLSVDDRYHGRGIGRSLMETLEARAVGAGVTRLHLLVHVTNIPAIGLYLRMGYEIEGLLREHYVVGGQAINAYFMGRRLSASVGR